MKKKNWKIRKTVIADAEALTNCMYASYEIYSSRLKGETLPPLTVDYAEEINSYPVWIAESDNKLVGGLILMPEDDYMTIANVAVHPQFQKHGLGKGLMSFAEDYAKQQGYKELRLATHILFSELVSLYSHLGWSEFSRDDYRVYMKKII